MNEIVKELLAEAVKEVEVLKLKEGFFQSELANKNGSKDETMQALAHYQKSIKTQEGWIEYLKDHGGKDNKV